MNTCRLLLDSPRTGPMNMAVDAMLLRTAAGRGEATLRLYRWSEPTLSLGYFQAAADRKTHQASLHCDWVRRTTGGGAILHDHELTYSFVTPVDRSDRFSAHQLYLTFHHSLLEAFAKLGLPAHLCPQTDATTSPPFLCFERRSEGDLLAADAEGTSHKICGSAQRRSAGALLQHGSILLAASRFAPHLQGVSELAGQEVTFQQLTETWLALLTHQNAFALVESSFSKEEEDEATELARQRYQAADWNEKR